MKTDELHARLVVHGLPEMRKPTKDKLVKWLREQAAFIDKTSVEEFSTRFTARLEK